MSDLTGEAQIRMGVAGGNPLVVDAGAAPDDVFSVMADERRRQVLAVLADESTAMDVSTVVERVADRLPSDESKPPSRLRVTMRHRHLPEMDSAGLIEYDSESRTIEATDSAKL